MAVKLVIGRAGSGKTHRCFRAIVEAMKAQPIGRPIYWILPRQATFLAERQLACGSGLGGFCRARVLSFDELSRQILAECGGCAVPEVTQLGRQMILGHLLRRHEPELRFFSRVARHPGLAARIESTLGEFERSGKDPQQVEALLTQLGNGDAAMAEADPLAAKLHDLLLIYKAYCQYLGQAWLDPRRRMEQMLECMGRSSSLCGAEVYVDGFSEFDESERRILGRLGKMAGRVEITLLMDGGSTVLRDRGRPEELSLFHRFELTYGRLVKAIQDEGAKLEPTLALEPQRRFARPALAEVEKRFFDDQGTCRIPHEGIELVEAPDRRCEVEHVARRIRTLAQEGVRYRQIAVLARSLEPYRELVQAAFREHGVRFFIDTRRTMSHHPLLHFLRSILSIAREGWPHAAVMALIKSGLGGISEAEADELENYVLEHHLRGAGVWLRDDPWMWQRSSLRRDDQAEPETSDECARMDAIRRGLRDRIAPFADVFAHTEARAPLRQAAVALFDLMDRFGVRSTIAGWIEQARRAQNHEQAGEHQQAWDELARLFDQMVDLLGDESVTLAGFGEILDSGLETLDLAITPPAVDEVLVGQIDRTRTPDAKTVFVLGLNEGLFPSSTRDASILSDNERLELERRQFELDPGTERRLLDENVLAYIAMTRGSERLCVSRSLSDEAGRPLAPSPYWQRLREMFPEMPVQSLGRDERMQAALIGTPRQLLTTLMRWARDGGNRDEPEWPALYQWLATYPHAVDGLGTLRRRAWKALSHRNAAKLSEPAESGLFANGLKASVSQIETFASCPFKHFLQHGLALRPRREDDVLPIDMEGAFRRILDHLARQMLRRGRDWSSLSPEQAGELVHGYAEEMASTLRGELMLSSARNRYVLGRIERALGLVIAAQQALARRGDFRMGFSKLRYGDEQGSLPALAIQTPAGRELRLSGQIDRVDLLAKQAAFAVFDYRLFGGDVSLGRVYHGLSLQLLSHLIVLAEHGERMVGRPMEPAGAFYVRLLRQLELVRHPSDAPEPTQEEFHLRGKPRGVFDSRYLPSLDNQCESGASEVVAAYLKKDGEFGHKGQTDVADAEEFAGLLRHAKKQLASLGDQIIDGNVEIRPYRMGTRTPCPSCPYKSVCRFEPGANRYRHIAPMGREDVLRRVAQEGAS